MFLKIDLLAEYSGSILKSSERGPDGSSYTGIISMGGLWATFLNLGLQGCKSPSLPGYRSKRWIGLKRAILAQVLARANQISMHIANGNMQT